MKKKGNKRMPTPKQKLIRNPFPTSLLVVCLCAHIILQTLDRISLSTHYSMEIVGLLKKKKRKMMT